MARWKPSEEQIQIAMRMAKHCVPYARIANYLGVSLSTFELAIKKCDALRQGLSKGRSEGIEAVCRTGWDMAVSGQSPTMTIFFLKTQAGFKETTILEHTGANGEPIRTKTDAMTREEKVAELARMTAALTELHGHGSDT